MKMCRSIIYALIIIFAIFTIGCLGDSTLQDTQTDDQVDSKINITKNIENTLIGHQITYYDIAGNPRYYNISKKDIQDIKISEYDNQTIWVVKVGQGMQWEIYLNETGEKILKEIQLFRT